LSEEHAKGRQRKREREREKERESRGKEIHRNYTFYPKQRVSLSFVFLLMSK